MELSKFEIYHSFDHHNYKLRFEQLSDLDDSWKAGGYTITYDSTLGVAGVSVCSPKDQFSRKTGREFAINRMQAAISHRDRGGFGTVIVVPRIHGGKLAQQLRRAAIMDAVCLMDKAVWIWGTMTLLEQ